MAETRFDEWIAAHYEILWPELFEASVISPAVDFLEQLAGPGPCLEFGIGTGRLALPLARRGLPVHGIELSPAMIEHLRVQPGSTDIGVTVGDFATTHVGHGYSLVYLVRNTITNLTTADEQIECFRNAAAHLQPGGHFVIENYVPALQRLPPGETKRLFAATPTHVAFEEYDIVAQIATSHHYWVIDGQLRTLSSPHRYLWPSELDLMADLAGLRFQERWSSWDKRPFTSASEGHISVWSKPASNYPADWV